MMLSLGDLLLKRVDASDIELLRQWRNDPKISKRMFFQEQISEEMQLSWFKRLETSDYYFLIQYKDEKVGVVHLNINVDFSYVGLFIHADKYWGTPVPIYASLCLLQFAFEEMNLQCVFAKVRMDNSIALKYNHSLGFVMVEQGLQRLDKEVYFSKLLPILKRFSA